MLDDLLEPFERYARAAGAQVSVVNNESDAATLIAGTTDGVVRCTRAVAEQFPLLLAALEASGKRVSIVEDMDEPGRSELAAALAGGVGIAHARAGIAETGSLIMADNGLAPRLLTMLADICVVLVPESSLVPSLDEAAAILSNLTEEGHRYVSMVTGPSRTADIERVLTIGVQGPKALHIILLTEKGV